MAKTRRNAQIDYESLLDQGYSPVQARRMTQNWRSQQRRNEAARSRAEEHAREDLAESFEWTDVKSPTNTLFDNRPRTNEAFYDGTRQILNIRWARPGRLGNSTNYYNVSLQEWENMKTAPSTGRYINNVLNYHPYDYPD